MLIAAGQPHEVRATVRDVDDELVEPTSYAATLRLNGGDPVAAVTREVSPGVLGARLPASMLRECGQIEIAWTWDVDGELWENVDHRDVTTVPLATPEDLADLPNAEVVIDDVPRLARVAISIATEQIESATNHTWSPRRRTDLVAAERGIVRLSGDRPTKILTATDAAGNTLDLDDVEIDADLQEARIPGASGLVTISYLHGLDRPPGEIRRAVAVLASAALAAGPWDDRGYTIADDDGITRLLTAGVGRAMFSIPEVEAVVKRRRQPVIA